MQSTTSLYQTIYAGLHHQQPKMEVYTSDGQTLVGTFGTNRLISLETKRGLFNKDDFCIGCCIAGEIDVEFYPCDENWDVVTIPRMAMLKVFVRLVSDDGTQQSEWLPKGVFFVDTRKTDKASGVMTIHGFDAMLKTENQYPGDAVGVTYPCDDSDMVDLIAAAIGVSVDSRTYDVITDDYQIGLPLGYSMREVLSAIAIPYCANFCISDEGKLLAVGAVVTPPTHGLLMDNVSGLPINIGGVNIIV